MDTKPTLLEKLQSLPSEELQRYRNTTTFVGRTVNVLGVLSILCMLMVPTVLMFLIGSVIAVSLANFGANVNILLKQIDLLQIKTRGADK